MSKRNNKKQQAVNVVKTPQQASKPTEFGLEEMLSELEAIVAEAETRQSEEQTA